jgi:hypothetical protein
MESRKQGVHKNCPTKRALDAGDSAAFSSIFLASVFSTSQTLSTPAPAPVTLTVGLPLAKTVWEKYEDRYSTKANSYFRSNQ